MNTLFALVSQMMLSAWTYNTEIVILSPRQDCAPTSIIKSHVVTLVEIKRESITGI